ncbi:MAG: thiamine-phosphate kinase [Alphaproteobacteria bacterium]|nr:thiamine-phosphate kinase [Alphaproteobacteria bacterium]
MDEFEIIEKYFRPLAMGQAGTADFLDDAATVIVPNGYDLVVTSDTINANTHFLKDEDPVNIAKKALRVNISDLAAMGAKPLCYQLNLAFPEKPSAVWLQSFSKALLEDNILYDIYCSGGDTTSIQGGHLSISITAIGLVRQGMAVRRGGAQHGDYCVVTGPVGDAALGLKAIKHSREKDFPDAVARYRVPKPRADILGIMQYAHASTDISDGLWIDVEGLARTSGLGVDISVEKCVFSQSVQRSIDEGFFSPREAFSGGDDYELILAIPEKHLDLVILRLADTKINTIKSMVIGQFDKSKSGLFSKNNDTQSFDGVYKGWKHF